jgi:hypothetical protein
MSGHGHQAASPLQQLARIPAPESANQLYATAAVVGYLTTCDPSAASGLKRAGRSPPTRTPTAPRRCAGDSRGDPGAGLMSPDVPLELLPSSIRSGVSTI